MQSDPQETKPKKERLIAYIFLALGILVLFLYVSAMSDLNSREANSQMLPDTSQVACWQQIGADCPENGTGCIAKFKEVECDG